jgi:hypothetical protein
MKMISKSLVMAGLLALASLGAQAQTTPHEKLVLKAHTELFAQRDASAQGRYWGTP